METTLSELAAHYREAVTPRGEIVICVAPPEAQSVAAPEDVDRLLLSFRDKLGRTGRLLGYLGLYLAVTASISVATYYVLRSIA